MRSQTLGDIAVQRPKSIGVFEQYGIDFCCRGQRTLEEACTEGALDFSEVLSALEQTEVVASEWEGGGPIPLIDHILQNYHRPLDRDLPVITALATKVATRHGAGNPNLVSVQEIVGVLVPDLVNHMGKEEQVLFPMVRRGQGEMAGGPVSVMLHEHDDAGRLLAEIRALCDDYAPPEEACTSWRALYAALQQLELDLHKHIHLENNVLFPMILDGESA